MTPIIRNKADRERARKWLDERIARELWVGAKEILRRSDTTILASAYANARRSLCGSAPKPTVGQRIASANEELNANYDAIVARTISPPIDFAEPKPKKKRSKR